MWLSENRTEITSRWVPAILEFDVHLLWTDAQHVSFRKLVAWLYLGSPREVYRAVRALIRQERGRQRPALHVLTYIPAHAELSVLIQSALRGGYVSLAAFRELGATLLTVDQVAGLAFAARFLGCAPRGRQQLARHADKSAHRRRRRFRSGKLASRRPPLLGVIGLGRKVQLCRLLMLAGSEGWLLVRTVARRNPRLSRIVRELALDSDGLREAAKNFEADVVADFYEWLLPQSRSEGSRGTRRRARLDWLLNILVQGASLTAVDALSRLYERNPLDEAVRFRLPDAVRRYHDATWTPLQFAHVAQLANRHDRRVVGSDTQLMQAIIDAIALFERELHGERPTVGRLWNYEVDDRKKTYWPKDEDDLSDELARFLRIALGGVIVNREVEIRPAEDQRRGQYVDLLVEAFAAGSDVPLAVVVEVKGLWNAGLERDLEDQLVSRYLSRGELTHGIYLVGWFSCKHWRANDARRDVCRRRERAKIQAQLEAQAKGASVGLRRVEVVIVDAAIE
jgi:hypothetical protein